MCSCVCLFYKYADLLTCALLIHVLTLVCVIYLCVFVLQVLVYDS